MFSSAPTYQSKQKKPSQKTHNDLFFQPKLAINQPNDIYEHEADAMADKVMRMPGTSVNNNLFFKPAISAFQRKCAHCEEEEKKVQRKESSNDTHEASVQTENYINSLSGGSALNDKDKIFFESRMGHDFSNVRLHTDNVAAKSARSVNALAYTTGNNIVFTEGQYSTGTDAGKKLMAHELTHVVQQRKNLSKKIQKVDDASFEASSGVDQGIANKTMTQEASIMGQAFTVKCGFKDYSISFKFTKAMKGVYPYKAAAKDVRGIYVKIEASITDNNYCGRCTPLRLLQSIRNITKGSTGDVVTADPDDTKRRERSGWSDPKAPSRGWRVDRINSATQPYYTSGSNGQEGSESTPAILWDVPGDWSTDKNSGKEFYTCAVCQNLANKRWTAACVSWGYYIDSTGAIAFRPATPAATCGNPVEVKDATQRWDAISGNTATGITF